MEKKIIMKYIQLMGAEDVSRAGSRIASAAQEMQRAASSIECSLHTHRVFLDEWLSRFEDILKKNSEPKPHPEGNGRITRSTGE